MNDDLERFVANNNKLRILSRVKAVRVACSIDWPNWGVLRMETEEILNDADIEAVTKEEFLDGNGDAMLLFKWADALEDGTRIAQLQLLMDMQIPGTDERHISIVWLSESLCVLDMSNENEVEAILLNEVREFAAACQKACSLPG